MLAFGIDLCGYDSSTSDTDDLVKWVSAPSVDAIANFVEQHELGHMIQTGPYRMEEYDGNGLNDGMDLIVNEDGEVTEGSAGWKYDWQSEIETHVS